MSPAATALRYIILALNILQWIIIIDAVLTWIPSVNRYHPIVVMLRRITTPIYKPIRALIPPEKTGYMDLSPMIAIFAIWILQAILSRIAASFYLY